MSIAAGLSPGISGAIFAVRGVRRDPVGRRLEERTRAAHLPLFTGPEWPIKAGGMIPAAFALKRALLRFKPDVIHLHTEIPEAAFAMLAVLSPATIQTALVRTIHHAAFWTFWPKLGKWCERRLLHGRVVGVSKDALEGFDEHRLRSGMTKRREGHVIYNGVEPPTKIRTAPNTVHRPIRVLYAGRLDWDKGADLIPEIIRRTKVPRGGLELTVHGEGRKEAIVKRELSKPVPGCTIKLLPPTDRLQEVFSAHDLLIMPSRIEGLGLVAIEASLSNLPVVATRARGLREALPVDHPWLPDPGDPADFARALSDALIQPALRETATVKASQLARKRFDPRVMLESYASLHHAAAYSRGQPR